MKIIEACENCTHCRAYYRLGIICFWVGFHGECMKSGKRVDIAQSCEFWERTQPHRKVTAQTVEQAIENVGGILQLLNVTHPN